MACTVHFHYRDGTQIFRVPSAAVAAVLWRAWASDARMVVQYRGTPADLLAAGVVDPEMVDLGGAKRQRSGTDAFGDRWQTSRLGGGKLGVVRLIDDCSTDPGNFGEAVELVRDLTRRLQQFP